MKIPYTLVSMAAILRDYADMSNAYINIEHKRLVDIADSLYNVGITPDDFKTEYKKLYDQYGKAYFDKVLDDMDALDGQLTSDAKVQELADDYADRLDGVTASTKVSASSDYDTKTIARYLKAKFDDEAFGTAYTMHRISNEDAYMGRNKLSYNRRNNTIDRIGNTPEEDTPIFKVVPQYSSTKRQGTYAPKMPKLVPIDEWNAAHGVTASTRVTATEDNVTTIYGDYDTTLTIDMWYGDKFVPRKYGADASFYGNDGEYRGNIYNESGKIIGDYTSDNSVLIEKNFLIDFGE